MANIHYSNSGGVGPQGPVGPKGDTGATGPSGASAEVIYAVAGGTTGTQPQFDGDPLFSASSISAGNLIHFRITVDFTNITNFGTGQYYMTLPFNAKYPYYFREGHLYDNSTSKLYSTSGRVEANSNMMYLYSTASNGTEVPFTNSVPFNLDVADDFHISGGYIKA